MNKIKKLLAGLVSLSMVFVMASCGETEESSTANKTEETTTSAETEVTTEEAAEETEEAETEEVEEEEEEVEVESNTDIDKSKLVYDFAGLDSEEFVKIFTSGKYTLNLDMSDLGANMTFYFENEKCRQSVSVMGMEYDVLIVDDKAHMLIEGAHCEVSMEEAGMDPTLESMDMFAELGYYESGETDYKGTTCKYDQYYESVSDTLISFIMDDSNELIAIESDGMVMGVSEYSADFDASLLEIPVDSELVDMEELYKRMSEMSASALGGLVEGEETAEEGAETEATEGETAE
ncbi:MAG: hypothetical protein IJP18_03805 [Oscillospiraceae bacterium]|nr:hypothetical protein [Oscillospiraceae bacterium]